MKRKLFQSGMIAIVLLLGTALIGCPPPLDDGLPPEKFTVTFNSNGGSAVAEKTVVSGGTITLPTEPTKENNTFGGWFTKNGTDNDWGSEFTEQTPVTADITVYAKWIQNGQQVNPSTKEVTNDEATLGLTGTSAVSSDTSIATVVIADGKVKITSVATGSAVITVKDAANHAATIAVTVSATGEITLGTITKYNPEIVFTVSTNDSTANDEAILGLIGTSAVSSDTNVATVAIVDGKIKITSAAAGTATITVKDALNHTATIAVTVSATGEITLGTITKYVPEAQNNNEGFLDFSSPIVYTGIVNPENITFTHFVNPGAANSFAEILVDPSSSQVEAEDNGTFTIKLGTVKDSALTTDIMNQFTMNPADLKVFFTMGFADGDENTADKMIMWNKDDDNHVELMYANKDGTITGTNIIGGDTATFNLNLKHGWNSIIIQWTDETTMTATTGVPDSSYKWEIREMGSSGSEEKTYPFILSADEQTLTINIMERGNNGVIFLPNDPSCDQYTLQNDANKGQFPIGKWLITSGPEEYILFEDEENIQHSVLGAGTYEIVNNELIVTWIYD